MAEYQAKPKASTFYDSGLSFSSLSVESYDPSSYLQSRLGFLEDLVPAMLRRSELRLDGESFWKKGAARLYEKANWHRQVLGVEGWPRRMDEGVTLPKPTTSKGKELTVAARALCEDGQGAQFWERFIADLILDLQHCWTRGEAVDSAGLMTRPIRKMRNRVMNAMLNEFEVAHHQLAAWRAAPERNGSGVEES